MTSEVVLFENVEDEFKFCQPGDYEDLMKDEKWRKLAELYFGETPETKPIKLKALKEALQKEDFLSPTDENYNEALLRAGSGDAAEAVSVARNYFKLKLEYPHYFEKDLPSKLLRVLDLNLVIMLPHRDKYGRRVCIVRETNDPSDLDAYTDIISCLILSGLIGTQELKTSLAGVTLIFDRARFSYKHLMNTPADKIRIITRLGQDSFPLWFRQIHIVNEPMVFSYFFALFKPFLNEKVRNKIIFHGSNMNSLHQHIDPEILPKELGGEQGPYDSTLLKKILLDKEDWLKEFRKYGYPT